MQIEIAGNIFHTLSDGICNSPVRQNVDMLLHGWVISQNY